MTTLMVRDDPTGVGHGQEFELELLKTELTLRELIRERVYQEVRDYNAAPTGNFRGLVAPSGAEQRLEGFVLKKGRRIEWERQYQAAVEAFERNTILVLVGDRQLSSLDEVVRVEPSTEVTFLRLTPLVGG